MPTTSTRTTSTRKAIVPCRDANGVPTFYVASVRASPADLKDGNHYTGAVRQTEEAGFDVPDAPVVIDREDARLNALETVFDIIVYELEGRGHGRRVVSLLEKARDKLRVAREIVDPARKDGRTVPFADDLVDEIHALLSRIG